MDKMEKILYLTLKKQWYDLIDSNVKTEEYREIKPYWIKRLTKCKGDNSFDKTGFYCAKANCHTCLTMTSVGFHPSDYTHVHFRLGYAKEAPTMLFEIEGFSIGKGKPEWGGSEDDVFIIKLGKRLK